MNLNVFRNDLNRLRLRLLIALLNLGLFMFVTFLFYNFIIVNKQFNIYEIAGSIPYHPYIYLRNSYLTAWELYTPFGSPGMGLIVSLFYNVLDIVIKSHLIAERVWLVGQLLLGYSSFYILSRKFGSNRFIASVFSISYTFSPVVTNMVISGAYMIMLLYETIPILIFLFSTIIDFSVPFVRRLYYSTTFALLLSVIYEFNPGAILWTPVLLLLTFVAFFIMEKIRLRNWAENVVIFVLIFVIFLILTNTIQLIIGILRGNSISYFSSNDFGAHSISDILVDMTQNFNGWLSFQYWYSSIVLLSLSVAVFAFLIKKRLIQETIIKSLIVGCFLQMFIILFIWGTFHFKVLPIEYLFAKYTPFVEEYIPHMGYVLIVGLFIVQSMLLVSAIDKINMIILFKKLRRHKVPKFSTIRNSLSARCISILILVTCLVIPVNMHTNFPHDYSTVEMISGSAAFMNENGVPESIYKVSSWFYNNTNLSQEYRVIFFPYEVSTDNNILKEMPWTYNINLTNQAYPSLHNFIENKSSLGFATYLAESDVEFLIVYGGPTIGTDNSYYMQGEPNFIPGGYSWDTDWVPVGSAKNWTELISSSHYFSKLATIGNTVIFKNNLYVGDVIGYKIGNMSLKYVKSNLVNPRIYGIDTMDLLIKSNVFQSIPNWVSNNVNHTKITGSAGNQTITEANYGTNIYNASASASFNLTNNTYYIMDYSFNFRNIDYGGIILYFYYNGDKIASFVTNNEINSESIGNGTIATKNIFVFKTPVKFNKVIAYALTNFPQSNSNNSSFSRISNISIEKLYNFAPYHISYFAKSPADLILEKDNYSGSIINFFNEFNSGWAVYNGNEVISGSFLLNQGYTNDNYFFLSSSNKSMSGDNQLYLFYGPQSNYTDTLLLQMIEWLLISSISLVLLAYFKFKGKIQQK